MAKPTWIKLELDIFDNTKIKMMRKMPLIGDHVIDVWVYLLTRAGRSNDDGAIMLDRNIPYTPEMIAIDGEFDETTVKLVIEQFVKFGMLEQEDNGALVIADWEEHQNVDGLARVREQTNARVQKYRERKKLKAEAAESIKLLPVTLHETLRNAPEENRRDKNREDKTRTEKISSSNSNNQSINTQHFASAVSSVSENFGYEPTPAVLEGIGERILQPLLEAGTQVDDLIPMMSEAFKTTALNDKHAVSYAAGVIRNWIAKGVLTPESVIEHRNQVRQQNPALLTEAEKVDIPTDVDILNTDWSKFK